MAERQPLPAQPVNLGRVLEVDLALAASADWPKMTLDFGKLSGAEELRHLLVNNGVSVATFKAQPIYKAALVSGRYPWLSDL